MVHQFYFLCPACLNETAFRDGACPLCKSPIQFSPQGITSAESHLDCAEYYQLLEKHLAQRLSNQMPLTSAAAELYHRPGQLVMSGYHRLFRRRIAFGYTRESVRLRLDDQNLAFLGKSDPSSWSYRDILCVTTTGHYLLLKLRGTGPVRIAFKEESPLKYQILLRNWLAGLYMKKSGQVVREFQPTVRLQPLRPLQKTLKVPIKETLSRPYVIESLAMRSVAWLVRQLARPFVSMDIRGGENWGDGRGGMAIMNHQSHVDPFLFGAFFDYKTAFLTKSSVFAHGFTRFFMRWARGIPTTRFQGDPIVVRHVVKLLSAGFRVGVFPEGERTWDGRLLPFRMGTVKLLMALRLPIYPIVIDGAYAVWPRWANWPSRHKISVRICPPFVLLSEYWTVDEQRQFLENYFQSVLQSPE